MDEKQCKTCSIFKRGRYINMNTEKDEGPRSDGHCELLLKLLQIENYSLISLEKIYIQDTFRCVFHKEKEEIIEK